MSSRQVRVQIVTAGALKTQLSVNVDHSVKWKAIHNATATSATCQIQCTHVSTWSPKISKKTFQIDVAILLQAQCPPRHLTNSSESDTLYCPIISSLVKQDLIKILTSAYMASFNVRRNMTWQDQTDSFQLLHILLLYTVGNWELVYWQINQ